MPRPDRDQHHPRVTVDLDVTQEYLVKPGRPGHRCAARRRHHRRAARIESVGNVATCPGGGRHRPRQRRRLGRPVSRARPAGSDSSSAPTVTVTITLGHAPRPGATFDQAPVNVNITTQTGRRCAGRPGQRSARPRRAAATASRWSPAAPATSSGSPPGLYSNTLVQISGAGISAGTRVEVPVVVTPWSSP